jgi:hypothetical protein
VHVPPDGPRRDGDAQLEQQFGSNPFLTWGYTRVQGALKNLWHRVARSTIATILKQQGVRQVVSGRHRGKRF